MSKIRIKKINPISAGKVSAVITFITMLVVFIPIMFFATLEFGNMQNDMGFGIFGGSIAFMFMLPFIYSIFAFVGGVVSALVYNALFRFHNGLEFEIEDEGQDITKIGQS